MDSKRSAKGATLELTCNHLAIDSTKRARYDALLKRLAGAVISFSEVPDGYVCQLNQSLIGQREVSEWMSMEQLCCPFLSIKAEPALSGVLELSLTGPSGSKAVLLSEVGNYLNAKTE